MKRLLCLTVLALSLFSCKKEKDEPVLTNVKTTMTYLYYKEEQGFNTENWFSIDAMEETSMPQININASWQPGVLLGYYSKDKEYGIYSPHAFPIEYGQENWVHKPATVTFKKAKMSMEELELLREKNPNGMPVQAILDAWNNGINPRAMVTHPHEGEVYAFSTADGKIKGMFQIMAIASQLSHIVVEIWFAK